MSNDKKLYEIKHPYYCEEGGYYYRTPSAGWGAPMNYESFSAFLQDWQDADLDMNFIFRWDWQRYTPEEFKDEHYEDLQDSDKNTDGNFSQLKLFYMLQRKGCKKVVTIKMLDSDEIKAKEFLSKAWEHMKLTWEGVS